MMPPSPLRVLLLEDSSADAELLELALEEDGMDVAMRRVEGRRDFEAALRAGRYDVILADYSLPGFDGLSALRLVRTLGLDIPFLVVSGAVGEEIAVRTMREGASDYVLKASLTRLGPAVRREVHESQRRRAERDAIAAAARSYEHLELRDRLVRRMPLSVVVVELSEQGWRVRWHNEALARLLRFDESAPGLLEATFPNLASDELTDALQRAVLSDLPQQIGSVTYKRGETGDALVLEVRVVPLGESLAGIFLEDATERVQLESQVRGQQRMESIGRLAGGVAHDFNNLLTVIRGFGELVSDGLEAGSSLHDDMQEILQAAGKAQRLTSQLLAFSRRRQVNPSTMDLNGRVAELERMLARLVGQGIDLHVELGEAVGCVHLDPSGLDQVLMNLAANARDAMPGGGTLRVRTERCEVGLESSAIHAVGSRNPSAGPYVMLSVSDSGVGMDASICEHIFEPFFTTKPVGAGTGLGLATVMGIVRQAGGWVEVESVRAAGTTFRVFLPRVPLPAQRELHPATQESRGGSESILVVDDDPALARLAARALGRRGYGVALADNVERAFESGATASPDLLVADVQMLHESGWALAERIASIRPRTKLLFTSGATDEVLARFGVLVPEVALLRKPYSCTQLEVKVRAVLDSDGFSAKAFASRKPTVLIVDDDTGLARSLERMLKSRYCVRICGDAQSALQRIRDAPPDVVLCDYEMPGMDGRELQLATRVLAPALVDRFVFMTGTEGDQLLEFTRWSRHHVLHKPFERSELLAALDSQRGETFESSTRGAPSKGAPQVG